MKFVSYLKSQCRKYAITASTGVAAVAIGGCTIHSFSGIGLGDKPAQQLVASMLPKAKARLCAIDVLILDEISLISADLFDKLDQVFRTVRANNQSSFGGVQLVISGDYLQLAPIEKSSASATAAAPRVRFAFESKAWRECIPSDSVILLNTVYRQRGDDAFVRSVPTYLIVCTRPFVLVV
jgi:ATP-dependent DNA helicase PIF1